MKPQNEIPWEEKVSGPQGRQRKESLETRLLSTDLYTYRDSSSIDSSKKGTVNFCEPPRSVTEETNVLAHRELLSVDCEQFPLVFAQNRWIVTFDHRVSERNLGRGQTTIGTGVGCEN